MAPGALEQLLRGLAPRGSSDLEQRVIAGRARNEDAVVVRMPAGKAIVQTVDILAPIVNDAFWFGRIAACNALSDVYALGGQPWCAMNVAFFPTCLTENDPENILANILRGGMDALEEAGAVLAGGHTVQDDELKYGMGIIDPDHVAANDKLRPGLRLLLTKPLGTGILATGVKARWDDHEESEALLQRWCGRLNRIPGEAIAHFRIPAATDITGFGLGGHLLEMAQASGVCVSLQTEALPLLPHALEYARMGLIPAGSHLNRTHCAPAVDVASSVDEAVESIVFDAQTSGGIVLAVPGEELATVRDWLGGQGRDGRGDRRSAGGAFRRQAAAAALAGEGRSGEKTLPFSFPRFSLSSTPPIPSACIAVGGKHPGREASRQFARRQDRAPPGLLPFPVFPAVRY